MPEKFEDFPTYTRETGNEKLKEKKPSKLARPGKENILGEQNDSKFFMDSKLTESEKIVAEVKRISAIIEREKQQEVERLRAEEQRKKWEEEHLRSCRKK